VLPTPYNKLTFNPNILTHNPPTPLYLPLHLVATLVSLETPTPTSILSSQLRVSRMACRLLDLRVQAQMAAARGLRAMRRRWGLRVEHRYSSSNYTKAPTAG
jgi:hypothetical protein